MQLSISFVALSVLSLCAASAVPEVTPTAPAVGPGPTDASLPVVPEYLVAEYLASLNSTTTALEKRNVHCETSGGSPFTRDVADAINSFNGVDKCQQTNPGGSFCTTMGCRGSACGMFRCAFLVASQRAQLLLFISGCLWPFLAQQLLPGGSQWIVRHFEQLSVGRSGGRMVRWAQLPQIHHVPLLDTHIKGTKLALFS
jgi:hypothetical protein